MHRRQRSYREGDREGLTDTGRESRASTGAHNSSWRTWCERFLKPQAYPQINTQSAQRVTQSWSLK